MAVNIEIKKPENCPINLTVQTAAALRNLSYGVLDHNYCMDFGKTGQYTILYKADLIGRGWELWLEGDSVCMRLPLPNTESDIRMAYTLAQDICRLYNIDSFIVDDQIVPFEHVEQHIQSNISASIGAIQGIGNQIRNGEREAIILFGVTNPITVGLAEIEEIGDTMEGFEKFLHRLQSMDVYYANPKYYKLQDEQIFGLYFIGENITSVVPKKPSSPFAKIDNLKGYYVHVPDGNDIPYDEFISIAMKMGDYDSNHVIVCLTEKNLAYFAENSSVYVDTDRRAKGVYWGRMIDNGRNHMNKVSRMELATDELSGLNHLAVFLRWAAENKMLSNKLKTEYPELEQIIADKEKDLRQIIRDSMHFNGRLRGYHFNKVCMDFAKSFYVFGRDGYPACVDEYAEKVLGTEKYNCEEYKDEAYLFVPYNEEYYKGLSKYIDKAWKKFNR